MNNLNSIIILFEVGLNWKVKMRRSVKLFALISRLSAFSLKYHASASPNNMGIISILIEAAIV